MSTALVALVLLPLALALVVGLVVLLAQPLLSPVLKSIERARFNRCVARVGRADGKQMMIASMDASTCSR